MNNRNQEAYDIFWHFVNARHQVYLNKEAGLPKPWTDDPILQEWKFCNVFRKLDKQSKWLIENVIEPHLEDDPSLMLFNIFLFRAFNWYPTFEWLTTGWTGQSFIYSWNGEAVKDRLYVYLSEENRQLTSGAYMLRGREGMPKYESIVMTLDTLWQEQKNWLTKTAIKERSLQNITEEIVAAKLWGWGPFTSYQVALDLTYSPILPNPYDINTWCEFGPGAKRGLELIWPGIKSEYHLLAARQLWEEQVMNLEDHVPDMTLQDIEFSLCELQKYWRILKGGRAKERYNGTPD